MPRARKTEPKVVEHNPGAAPPELPVEVPEPPEAFKRLRAVVHKPNLRGRVSLYQPLFVPPGVRISFRLAPGIGTVSGSDFAMAKLEGWEPLPPELATNDPNEAIAKGKVGLLHFEVVDGLVRVAEHVVMYRLEEEVLRDYYEDLKRLSQMNRAPGVQVSEEAEERTARVAEE